MSPRHGLPGSATQPGQPRQHQAHDHARRQLAFYAWCGITHIDLACRYPSGAWKNYYQRPLHPDSLTDLRAANCRRGADIYIRPARTQRSPLLFLDDLPLARIITLLAHHPGMAIRTSSAGGCHLWLRLTKGVDIPTRARLQRRYAHRHHADLASTSGDHYGRLAGTKNHKRGGTWITCLADKRNGTAIDPEPERAPLPTRTPPTHHRMHTAHPGSQTPSTTTSAHQPPIGPDTSPSGREWAWVCAAIENGIPRERIRAALIHSAHHRRGTDTHRYVQTTIQKAWDHCRSRAKPPTTHRPRPP